MEEFAYRAYVTDCLRVLAMGKQYRQEIDRWGDIARFSKKRNDSRGGDEIAQDVIKQAGLVVNE